MRFLLLLSTFLFTVSGFAKAESFAEQSARREKLRQSARAWVARQALTGQRDLRVFDFGVDVQEKAVVLPPEFGGPDPKNALVQVDVKVWISGSQDSYGRWRDRNQLVRCEFQQKLMAKANRQGRPVSILPGQSFQSIFACASGLGPDDPYHRRPFPY